MFIYFYGLCRFIGMAVKNLQCMACEGYAMFETILTLTVFNLLALYMYFQFAYVNFKVNKRVLIFTF